MNILLCTLGGSWAVIPEVFALLDPDRCPLYQQHPERAPIEALKRDFDLQPVQELWVCTTEGADVGTALEHLRAWRALVDPGLVLRVWRAAEAEDVASQATGNRVRELIFRAVLQAVERCGRDGRLYLSLAGGRKTMSADLQQAGLLIGCRVLLHVIAPPAAKLSERMHTAAPVTFAAPLAPTDCAGLLPLVVGRGRRSELLDIDTEVLEPVRAADYPLPLAPDGAPLAWGPETEASLPAELDRRERQSSRLLGNFLQALGEQEHHENWRSLYRLPAAAIRWLREERLGEAHRDWLEALPKADLHRHIGGSLDLAAQRRVGRAVWESLMQRERDAALHVVRGLLHDRSWDWSWPEILRAHGDRAHNVAALLVEAEDEQLHHNLFDVTEPRRALREREPHRFAYYDRPGELTGSAVLTHPAALAPYVRELMVAAEAEGLRYLELRGSPQKYRVEPEQQLAFLQELKALAERYRVGPTLRFLVIADRRQAKPDLEAAVRLAVEGYDQLGGFVVGLDLAGDENKDTAESLDLIAAAFQPAYEACLSVTIHAGEGTTAARIWEAAYRLHADRVGHGLTLRDHPRLLQRFRDRGLCVELCPTSNEEVVGFDEGAYPLGTYWRDGVPLAVCTDNPGISRTTLADELLVAARVTVGGITLWDTLAMIKQGFVHGFLTASDRERLLKQADREVHARVLERYAAR